MQCVMRFLVAAAWLAIASSASAAQPGGFVCSIESTSAARPGLSWVQLAACPRTVSEARSSTTELPGGGRRIADYRVDVPVHEDALDHDALCEKLNQPSAEIGVTMDERTQMRAEARCD